MKFLICSVPINSVFVMLALYLLAGSVFCIAIMWIIGSFYRGKIKLAMLLHLAFYF